MEYNLTPKQKTVITWMVKANENGELDDDFSVAWVLGPEGPLIIGSHGTEPSGERPEITPGILDALAAEELILQDIKYQTKTQRSGTSRNPRTIEKQSERSRYCSLTKRASDAVESDFVKPDPQPTSSSTYNFHAPVNQSIIGNQSRAELTNNFDFDNLREQIKTDGGEDKEELLQVLNHVQRLLEREEYLDRGALAEFSEVMERHSWFTGSVMDALLGFATQITG